MEPARYSVPEETMQNVQSALPAHVPPDLVYSYPFRRGVTLTDKTPWDLADDLIENAPDIFWAPDLYPGGAGWVVTRSAEIKRLFFDTENFSNKGKFALKKFSDRPFITVPSQADPPDHTDYRMMINPMFTPKRIATLEEGIRSHARSFVDKIKTKRECDFYKEFAAEFPIKVFLLMMGMPLEMTPQFLEWERTMIRSADIKAVTDTIEQVASYLEQTIAERRKNPGDDLISYGARAEHKGRTFTDQELLGFCFSLFMGGMDTVTVNMSHHFVHLAKRPDHQAYLRADMSRASDAVEELARAYAVVVQMRDCIKETQIFGQTILPGDKLTLPTTLVNRAPAEFDRPKEVILDRKPRHLTFGIGPHLCLGVHLARRELRIAIEEFLTEIPEFRLPEGTQIRYDLGGVAQALEVPLVW
jgi:cytochrome P450